MKRILQGMGRRSSVGRDRAGRGPGRACAAHYAAEALEGRLLFAAITSGQTLSDNISAVGEQDTHTFSAAVGETFVVSMGTGGTAVRPWIRVRNPSGVLVAENFTNSSGTGVSDSFTVPTGAAGTYSVVVQDIGGTQTGAYTIELVKAPGPHAADAQGHGGAITSGQTKTGAIDRFGDLDAYTFTAAAGEFVVLTYGTVAGSNVQPWMRLFGPDGTFLREDFSNSTVTSVGVSHAVTVAGTYTVLVQENGDNATGGYTLEMLKAPGPHDADADGHGGTIASGQTKVGTINRFGDLDVYTFTAAVGETVALSYGTVTGSGVQPWMQLFGPSGNFLGENFSNSTVTSVGISHEAAVAGTYTVLLRENGGDATGGYTLEMIKAPGPHNADADGHGGIVTSGQTKGGVIGRFGDLDVFTFDGAAGENIVLTMGTVAGSSIQPWIRLFDPSGEFIAEDFSSSTTTGIAIRRTLTAAGTYTVLVLENGGDATGAYTLEMVKAPGPHAADTDGDGGAITSGQTKTGSINRFGDLDVYTFTAAVGETAVITFGNAATGTSLQTWMRLYGPSGNFISEDSTSSTGSAVGITHPVTAAGTYTVVLQENGDDGTGAYALEMVKAPGPHAADADGHGGAITSGQTKTGTINRFGDLDAYTFTAAAGETVLLHYAGAFQPYMRLYGPGGNLIVEDATSSSGTAAGIIRALTTAGTYTVLLMENGGDATGTYTLEMTKAPGPHAADADGDGGTITSGQTKTGTVNRVGDHDAFTFTGAAGETVLLHLGAAFQPYMRLFGPAGNLIIEDATSSSGTAAGIIRALTTAGTYTVVVQENGSDATGAYSLEMTKAPGPHAADAGGDGGVIASGQTKTGTINRVGDHDSFTFTGVVGETVLLHLGAAFQPYMRLFGPAGNLIIEDATSSSATAAGIIHAVTTAGTYTLVVQENGSDATGAYSLEMTKAPGPHAPDAEGHGGPLTSGQTRNATINRVGDHDTYTIQAAAGETFVVGMRTDASSSLQALLRVFGPTGALLAEDFTSGTNSAVSITRAVTAANAGTYTVVAQENGRDATGSYAVQMVKAPTSGAITPGTLAYGRPAMGRISTAGASQEWTFFGRAGEHVSAVVNPTSTRTPEFVAPFGPWLTWGAVSLLAPDGTTVLASASATAANQIVSINDFTLPADGTYRLRVSAPAGRSEINNYLVGVWESTPNVRPLTLNQVVTGTINSSFGTDQWTFSVPAGQQVQLDVVGASAAGALFTLTGPSGYTAFTDLAVDSALISLPSAGAYTVKVRSGSPLGGSYAFQLKQTTVTDLPLNVTFNGTLAGSGHAQLFKIDVPVTQVLTVALSDNRATDRNELYLKYGSPPTRSDFEHRGANAAAANQSVTIPSATAGTWYALVYGETVPMPGPFSIRATASPVILTGVTPTLAAAGAPATLTATGAGFTAGTRLTLHGAGATTYNATAQTVDSFTQMTAQFDLTAVPQGTYDVRVTNVAGQTATLGGAFTVGPAGQGQLDVKLTVPANLGRHAVATIYVEYANVGSGAMAAPLLVLQSGDADDSDKPILTLDTSRLIQNYWSDGLPPGTTHSVLMLASGAQPGLLNPGERVRVPVYYLGLRQPWNFDDDDVELEVRFWTADDATPINWTTRKESLRPTTLTAEQWDAIYGNLTGGITTTGAYVRTLSENAFYLNQLGQRVADVDALWNFEVQQAYGYAAVPHLETVVDAAMPTPGVSLDFGRGFGTSIQSRYSSGMLGRGWFTPWQTRLVSESGGALVRIVEDGGGVRTFQRDTRDGRYFSGPGDAAGTLVALGGGAFELRSAGDVTRFRTDGQIDFVAEANGNRITAAYGAASRLASLTHSNGASLTFSYNASGRLATLSDSAGRATTYGYDATNTYLTSVTSPDGKISRYAYQTAGTPQTRHALLSIEAEGTTRTFTYDARGRLDSTFLTGNAEFIDFGYDSAGTLSVTDAAGTTSLYFDHRALLVRTTDALGHSATTTYDANYRPTRITAPTGEGQTYDWTDTGALGAVVNELGQRASYAYDHPLDRLTSVTDANGNTTRYTYDAKGNLRSTVYANGTSETISGFTAAGLPEAYTNRRGQTASFAYNAAGQVTRQTFANGSFVDFTYDARGNLTSTVDGTKTTTYTYDFATDGDRLKRATYPNGRWLEYTYDAAGRRTRMTAHDGAATQYEYDAAGRLMRIRDAGGAALATYTYDDAGRLVRTDNGNGTFTTYAYDAADQVLSVQNWRNATTLNSRFDYTYDSRGRRVTMGTLDGNWAYTYDPTGQLTRAVFASSNTAVIPNQDLNYVYDAAGNRIRTVLNGVTTQYLTNSLNQYTSVGGVAQTYDADGNLTFDGVNTYTYDQSGRVLTASGPQGVTQYEYEAGGLRSAQIVNGVRTEFLTDPAGLTDLVAEYNAAGAVLARNYHGLGLANRTVGGTSHFVDTDALGSVVGLTGGAGTVVNRYAYAPTGQTLLNQESVANPFKYVGAAGVRADTTGGTLYMRARSYRPDLGRFTQIDPIRIFGGDMNLYRYVHNNHVSGIDPSGLRRKLKLAEPDDILDAGEILPAIDVANNIASGGFNADDPFNPDYRIGGRALGNVVGSLIGAGTVFVLGLSGPVGWGVAFVVGAGASAVLGPTGEWIGSNFDGIPIDPNDRGQDMLNRGFRGSYMPVHPDAPKSPAPKPDEGGLLTNIINAIANAVDPNDKFGADGFGPQAFIRPDTTIPYRIRFENLGPGSRDPDGNPYPVVATAPAQRVTISDPLEADLDWASVRITELGWGDTVITVPPDSTHFSGSVPMTYEGVTFRVDVEAGIDLITGRVFAVFQSIDPATSLPPDVLIGFLPPEDGTERGMGHFLFTARPKPGLPTGTEIRNVALISFDDQLTIATNQRDPLNPAAGVDATREALNTIDAGVPASQVAALPPLSPAQFNVSWSGADDAGGSGVANYDVYVSDNNGAYALWLDSTTLTQSAFPGVAGHTYRFYTIAADNVSNVEAAPASPDAQTTVTAADAAPTVTAVFVSSSNWNTAYRNSLAANGTGEAAFGYRIPPGEQTRALAWSNLNQVSVRFSENVVVAQNDLAISGVNVANHVIFNFAYDAATFTATWTLSQAIPNDKVTINLDADAGTGVTDTAGNLLDGEWTNPVAPSFSGDTFPTGNGTAGGDFVFNLRVLPGDIDRNGAVNIFDFNILKPNLNQQNRGVLGGDINGDNVVNIFDFNDFKTFLGKTTPA